MKTCALWPVLLTLVMSQGGEAVVVPDPVLDPALAPTAIQGTSAAPTVPADLGDQDLVSEPEVPVEPAIQPYGGTLAAGLAEVQALLEASDTDAALEVCDALLAPDSVRTWIEARVKRPLLQRLILPVAGSLGFESPGDRRAAHAHYARSIVQLMRVEPGAAESDLLAVRALAGPGQLRVDATYNLGWIDLTAAEAAYAEIPEVKGGAQAPGASQGPAGMPGMPGADQEEPPDFLAIARDFYLEAKEHLLEVLRGGSFVTGSTGADTRANLEWIQRRLAELDEIERQRKEQEQDEENQEEGEPSEDEQSDDSSDEGEEGDPEQSDSSEDEQEPSTDEQEPEEDPSDEEDTGEAEEDQEGEGSDQEQAPQPTEEHLTREEAQRLFELLNNIEEQGESVRKRLNRSRRVPVERDW